MSLRYCRVLVFFLGVTTAASSISHAEEEKSPFTIKVIVPETVTVTDPLPNPKRFLFEVPLKLEVTNESDAKQQFLRDAIVVRLCETDGRPIHQAALNIRIDGKRYDQRDREATVAIEPHKTIKGDRMVPIEDMLVDGKKYALEVSNVYDRFQSRELHEFTAKQTIGDEPPHAEFFDSLVEIKPVDSDGQFLGVIVGFNSESKRARILTIGACTDRHQNFEVRRVSDNAKFNGVLVYKTIKHGGVAAIDIEGIDRCQRPCSLGEKDFEYELSRLFTLVWDEENGIRSSRVGALYYHTDTHALETDFGPVDPKYVGAPLISSDGKLVGLNGDFDPDPHRPGKGTYKAIKSIAQGVEANERSREEQERYVEYLKDMLHRN